MLSYIQIVTTPTADTPGTCLILHFDTQRYVFGNISEGTQRAMVQRKVALSKTGDVFMTGQVNWHNAGGMLGMILTLADVLATQKEERTKKGVPEPDNGTLTNLRLHGGKNLTQFLTTARRFIFRKGMPLRPNEIRNDPRASNPGANPDWQDSNIKVWHMPVEAEGVQSIASSRKRSHEEMVHEDTAPAPTQQHPSAEETNQKALSEIVTQMFDSNWKLDALVETTLHQARLPAKLFVRNAKGHIQVYKGPLPGQAENVPDIPVLVRQPWPAAMIPNLPPTTPSRQSMSYIVKSHDQRGKFNVKEAQKYAIQKVDYKVLVAGGTVTASDGVVVTPEMVLGETVKGLGFAVLDVPEVAFIEPFIKRPEWSNEEILGGINVFFWIIGPGLIDDPRLQAFMQKMSSVKHIICSGDSSPNMLALESAAAQTYKLHQIDPERFPLPHFSNVETLSKSPAESLPSPLETGRTGKTIQLSPRYLHQDDKIIQFPDIPALAKKKEVPESELLPLIETARQKCSNPEFLAMIEQVESDIPNRDAEVITLGTGSALPSKYRNVSATLVRVPGYGNYLFDAGENTMGQLRRTFGDELPSVIRDLKVIWISHLHADHHLGTASVIKTWHNETRESNPMAKLHVASHVHMIDWIREYSQIEDIGYDRLTFTSIKQFDAKTRICETGRMTADQQQAYGLEKIDACYVDHCHGALATVFTWPSGLKIAYSGDCRPSDAFVQIGQGVTLLIHESTFDDELRGDAIAKKHSTMSEAIGVGRRMGARRIMLTHFSQRYQKISALDETMEIKVDGEVNAREKAKLDEVILAAFDYMRVKLGDFRKAQAFLPSIQRLLDDAEE
ncbi:hypothetical protein PFICI_07326 [Pestalotiopsis fici W106-1]|uniref:ribonuclease Z n=1 Tax=Pestalotiopsis fici (strain W106-1 / CGMCC3.15140) TaxID=1229662 RepID=W3X335_PESFW|nr:uncharacterized protein PFICI_07326 [Pestalotiopsis fici W106-1]ETS79797.1 hypothetical protein PFICI_07326 [Pestalotiopsis fici W106-1]